MASDIDRNIFFVPLEQRKKQLEQIPWVQSASVMRLLPNRLKIVVTERTPVAFVEVNSHIEMIDANGVIMEMPREPAAQLFVPGDRRHVRQRSAFRPRRAHEDLYAA